MFKISFEEISLLDLIKAKNSQKEINFENMVLIVNGKYAICQFLYSEYELKRNYILVESKKISPIRLSFLNIVIEDIVIKNHQLGKSNATIYRQLKEIKAFLDFLNDNKIKLSLDIEEIRNFFLKYTKFLQNSILNSRYTQKTASRLQKIILILLKTLIKDTENNIKGNIPLIHSGNEVRTTIPASKESIEKTFVFYVELFKNIYDFIINKKSYPNKFQIKEKIYFVLPYDNFSIVEQYKTNINSAFNTANGGILTYEDTHTGKYVNLDKQHRDALKKSIRQFNTYVEDANNDNHHENRKQLAILGMNAFYACFLFITGMNDLTAATLKWNDDYEIKPEKQKFRNIKYRANNKIVEFQILSNFVGLFHNFLELRKFLMRKDSKNIDFLFFQRCNKKNYLGTSQKAGTYFIYIHHKILKTIDSSLPPLNSRQIRLHKIKTNIKKHGIVLTSQLAQSKISTLFKHYTGENEITTADQLNDYFKELNKSMVEKSLDTNIKTPIGKCIDINNPSSDFTLTNIDISCKQYEGCLFCDKYRCHADEEDVRKLCSILFIIMESKKNTDNIEHFNDTYQVIIVRINSLLKELELYIDINKIKIDVFENENLSDYWMLKYEMLTEVGIL